MKSVWILDVTLGALLGSRQEIFAYKVDRFLTTQSINHPIQQIMSRTGSFPVKVAYDLLERYGNQCSVVLDPFCGKGTTLLAARIFGGLSAYGLDIAPEAVVCSSAKLLDVHLDGVCDYIRELRPERMSLENVPTPILGIFHPVTLAQTLGTRELLRLDIEGTDEYRKTNALFVMAVLLGILHGHASYSLSISSAHAYSMSPAYIGRFAATHGLEAPLRDVKECLLKKVARCLRIPLPKPIRGEVRKGSALDGSSVLRELIGRVDLVLTSPPYLNAQTYAKDNWLRLWLLGHDYKTIKPHYIETGSVERYKMRMNGVLKELHSLMRPQARLICIGGDVRLAKPRIGNGVHILQTGTILAELSELYGFRVEQSDVHDVPSNNRYFHALNRSNGHSKRDLVERVFVARKIG